MPPSLARRRAPGLLAIALILPLMRTAPPARADAGFVAKTVSTVSEVGNHRFPDGTPGNLGYKITTDVLEPMSAGEFFPTVRIDENQHPGAFEGQWADNGFHAAWVSRAGSSQFFPDAYTVESAYFDNYLDEGTLGAGDSFDTAVKQLPFDSPLDWSRERGAADGELAWEVATKVHRVAGSFDGHSSEMEVMFVRADLVSRGGDFDARGAFADTPPLVIDLPRSYGPDVSVGASTAQFSPYLHYLRNLEGQVAGQAGKAVFTAKLAGYLPEARERTLRGGTVIREWHIPLDIIITAIGRTGQVGGRSAISMPSGGMVKTFGALGREDVRVPPDSVVTTGNGITPRIDGSREASATDAPVTGAGGGGLLGDIEQLAPIDSSLDEPTAVRVAKRSYEVTIDPSLYGSGALGIGAVDHVRSGRRFLAAAAASTVEVDGRSITLDRSRLVELRVVPQIDTIRIGFTARSEGHPLLDPSSYSRARQSRIMDPGVNLEAVYDVGDGLYAFFTATAIADAGDQAQFDTWLTIRSTTGEPRQLRGTQYMETSTPGPFTYGGAPITNEFSGPTKLIAGDGVAYGGNAVGGGHLTIKRAAGQLTAAPSADPSIDVADQPLGVYLTSQNGSHSDYYVSYLTAGLSSVASGARFAIPDVGETCTDPTIVDEAGADAAADLDIRRAWFDYDGAHVYATLELSELNETVLAPARYRVGWRYDHIGYGLQAARDATGAWTYDLGLHPSAGAQWSRIATATGEVLYGTPGYIRIKAPARTTLAPPFFENEIFRDTGAVTYGPTTLGEGVTDRASSGAPEIAYGHGQPWTVGPCPRTEMPTKLELLDDPYEVQHSDALIVEALLTDASGPIAGEQVEVSFANTAQTVTTDDSGIARLEVRATPAPGEHELTVTYVGDGERLGSTTSAAVRVHKEDSFMSLNVTGTGSKRRVSATLVDQDDPTSAIAGRTIEFYADKEFLGTAITDESGTASIQTPPRYRGGTHLFEAVFSGDEWFFGSGASST